MNVLYISYDGITDPLGQSQIIPYLSGLSKKGHQITILSCEKKQPFKNQYGSIKKLLQKYNINWEPIPYSSYPPVLSTIWDVYKLKRKAIQLNSKTNFDIIHCRSYIASLIGLSLKFKYNIKFIFDMRGFWADERFDGNIWNNNNIIYRYIYKYFKKKERDFLAHADNVISLTENAKNEILSWDNIPNQPINIEVIPCCVDLNLFSKRNIDPDKLSELKEKLKITNGDFILSYLGSIGTWYMLDEMLMFFKRLLTKKITAKFLFITTEPEELIIKSAEKNEVPLDRIIIQKATREKVPTLLALSKLSIFFIKPVFSKKASSPTKLGEVLSMGIPVICNSNIGDINSIIQQPTSGILINHFNNDEYDRAIKDIDLLLAIDKGKIIETAKNCFSLQKGVNLYDRVYQQVMT